MKRILLVSIAIVAIAMLVLVVMRPKLEPDPPLPAPNGYDDFVKAAQLVVPNPPDWQSLNGDEQLQVLRKFTATNQAALDLVREGLTKECLMVPWEMNATSGLHLNELGMSKAVAQVIVAASALALVEGRTNDAAILAVDCVSYGGELGRGGVLIDGLVALAVKAIGLSCLQPAVDGMDAENACQAIAALDQVIARTESYDVVMKRERQWARRGRCGSRRPAGRVPDLARVPE